MKKAVPFIGFFERGADEIKLPLKKSLKKKSYRK